MRTPKLPLNQILSLLLVTTVLIFSRMSASDMSSSTSKENQVAGSGSSNYVPLQANDNGTAAVGASGKGDQDDKGNQVTSIPAPATSSHALTLINDKGICSSCACENAFEKSVFCFRCQKYFHAMCKIKPNEQSKNSSGDKTHPVICGKTFYNQFTSRIQNDSLQGSFLFMCDPCKTIQEQEEASNLQVHVHTLEKKVDAMEAGLRDIKALLSNLNTSSSLVAKSTLEKSSTSDKPSLNPWHDTQSLEKVKSRLPLIVRKNSSGHDVPDSDIEKIVMENNIQVDSNYSNKSGDRILVVTSDEDRKKLSSKLTDAFPESQVQQPPERLPTISVSNILEEIQPETLKQKIFTMHSELKDLVEDGEKFEVLYVKKQRRGNNYQACIRVSNSIRKFIEVRGNKLFIGMYSCNVYDHFYIRRCNNCQKFHHYADKCKAQTPTCAKCAGPHSTVDCEKHSKPGFKPTCVNCSQTSKQNFSHTHYATSLECPSYQAAQDELRKSIRYYNSKN